jgi:hypothetical protein
VQSIPPRSKGKVFERPYQSHEAMPTSTSANNGTISNEMAMKQSMQALGELAYALTELGVRATDPHEREGEPPGSMVLSTVFVLIEV